MTSRPRGRPRSHDPAATLRVVSSTFREGGYSATSLDDLARATGLNRPSLYAAFGDKKAMYLAALELLHVDLTAEFGALANAPAPTAERVRDMLRRAIDAYLAGDSGPGGCLAVCTAAAEATADADIRRALDAVLALIDRSLIAWFERGAWPDPANRARLVASVMHSLSIRARAGAPRAELDALDADVAEFATRP